MKKALLFLIVTIGLFATVKAQDTTSLTLQVGGSSKYAPINIKDQVTGMFVPGTISNVSVVNNNPEVATVIPNPSNSTSIKATAVAAGSGTALVSCQITYPDPGDGLQKTENKSIVISYTVLAAPHGVKLSLTF